MTTGRWAAVTVCAVLVLPFGLGLAGVASSLLATSPNADPHGYGLIFGTMFTVLFGSMFFAVLPLTAPAQRRRKWSLACLAAFVMMIAVLLFLLSTQ